VFLVVDRVCSFDGTLFKQVLHVRELSIENIRLQESHCMRLGFFLLLFLINGNNLNGKLDLVMMSIT
jgi:hypothetical protein